MTQQNNIKRIVVGMGLSGLSCARFLSAHQLPFDFADSRSQVAAENECRELYPQAQIFLGALQGELLAQYQEIILSPGVALAEPAIQFAISQGSKVRGDIDLFAEYNSEERHKPLIAITGSNGKSTVTAWLGEILNRANINAGVGGNIGLPALDLLIDDQNYDCYVLELSSFQLETTDQLNADVACILNLSEDHMDRYTGMADYLQAKRKIFAGCKQLVVNSDDAASMPAETTSEQLISTFSLSAPSNNQLGLIEDGELYLACGQEKILATNSLLLKGRHNFANALAAMAMIKALPESLALTWQQMIPALTSFKGLPHRCAWLADIQGVEYFNDSKGTNVGSTVAAIEGLAANKSLESILLIAGGVAKEQDFSPLVEASQQKIKTVYLFGQDQNIIAQAFEQYAANQCQVKLFTDLPQALEAAQQDAEGLAHSVSPVVLFSPACASFDQFKNFVQRGEFFEQLVERIASKSEAKLHQQEIKRGEL